MSDRIFAVANLAICGLIGFQMWNLAVPFAYEPVGPKAFPLLLAVLMAVCCVVMLLNPDLDISWPGGRLLIKGTVLIATLVVYAATFELLGFPLATAAMVLGVSRLYGGNWLVALTAGLTIGVFGYLLFDRLLQVTLPLGRLWT